MGKKKTEFEIEASEANSVSDGEITDTVFETTNFTEETVNEAQEPQETEALEAEQPEIAEETVIKDDLEISPIAETTVSPIADTIELIENLIAPTPDGEFHDDDIVTYQLRSGRLAYGRKKGVVKMGYTPIEIYQRPTKVK